MTLTPNQFTLLSKLLDFPSGARLMQFGGYSNLPAIRRLRNKKLLRSERRSNHNLYFLTDEGREAVFAVDRSTL